MGVLARAAGCLALRNGELHVGGVDLLRRQDADRKSKLPFAKPGAEQGRLAIFGIGQHAAEAGA
jgi:hypothetical protein